MSDAMAISRSGLDVEWQRLQIIAQNLANMNTSRTAAGGPYRALRLISGPDAGFDQALSKTDRSGPKAVTVLDVQPVAGDLRMSYDPTDPSANADGFVIMPNIDQAAEMTLMIRTSRSYEANLTALSIERQMFAHALEIGRSS